MTTEPTEEEVSEYLRANPAIVDAMILDVWHTVSNDESISDAIRGLADSMVKFIKNKELK